MTKTTPNPRTLASDIELTMVSDLEALESKFADYAILLEELKETNPDAKRFAYADTHADRTMACLSDALRHISQIIDLLQH